MMHIAYLINQYPKVSHTFVRREILALEQQGCDVLRIALRGWKEDLVDNEDKAERARTRYVLRAGSISLLFATALMLLGRPRHFLKAASLAAKMARRASKRRAVHFAYLAEACLIERWLRSAKIDHVHAHFGTNSAEVAMLVRALGGPPWSFTVHGPEEFDNWQSIGMEEKVRQCAFVVAVSSFGRSQLYRHIQHYDWPKVEVIHCGLDFKSYSAVPTKVPQEGRLVCVGRICREKGQLLLVEAAQQLAARGKAFELIFAGDGELRFEAEALISKNNLQGQVRITGWLSAEQVRLEVLAARALVLPTFAEGLPVVIMEAMALQRPVISTYIAGVPELVRSGVDGWLVPAGDLGALVDAMDQCLNSSSETVSRMGDAARQRVVERHDVNVETQKLVSLFKRASKADN